MSREERISADLTQDRLNELLLYDPETGSLFWRERPIHMFRSVGGYRMWNKRYAGREAMTADSGEGYKQGAVFKKMYRAHRVIWMMVYGVWPNKIDHINGNRSDNRLSNLRDVDDIDNGRNCGMQTNNKSGVIGVYWHNRKRKWCASICVDHRIVHLGAFVKLEDAANARKSAEIKYGFHENHGKRESYRYE